MSSRRGPTVAATEYAIRWRPELVAQFACRSANLLVNLGVGEHRADRGPLTEGCRWIGAIRRAKDVLRCSTGRCRRM